jgi:hypothetical protein
VSDDPVAKAARAYQRAQDTLAARRTDLVEAVVQAVLVHGRRQSEVARASGYTREHVRRLTREHVDTLNSMNEYDEERPPAG